MALRVLGRVEAIRATEEITGQEESLDAISPNGIKEPLTYERSAVEVGRGQNLHVLLIEPEFILRFVAPAHASRLV